MSILEITDLTHSFGDKKLYQKANLSLYEHDHMGIVGQNGTGKSTLFKICMGYITPDEGFIDFNLNKKVGYLDQYAQIDPNTKVIDYFKSAWKNLYDLEKKMYTWYEKYALGDEKALKKATNCQNILENSDFYQLDTKINKMKEGLGLSYIADDTLIVSLSGGQRAKVILAKLLLEEPDVLLLDEPTNFLDHEQIVWLESFLTEFPKAFMVISHDYNFLQAVCNCVCDLDMGIFHKYKGDYQAFLKQKQQLEIDYLKRYELEQKKIAKEEEFIRKNKAGSNSKMARGRQKQLDRMEKMTPPKVTSNKPIINFLEKDCFAHPICTMKKGSVGYNTPLLSNINFQVKGQEKIVFTGFNGLGKTTLLKTLMKEIPLLKGNYQFYSNAHIGYYEQDFIFQNKKETPYQCFANNYPSYTNKEIRTALAKLTLKQEQIMQPIEKLSGGEQAKLKLCLLLQKPYNILLLDEPTNHLDKQAKEALKEALQKYQGAVILVSHEVAFYKEWVDRVISLENYQS